MVGRLTALVATLVVVLLGGAATPARAADDSGTVVLGIEAVDTQDNNLASDVTDAIKQRVATGKGGPLIPGKDLVEIKLVFSCSDEAPACLAQAGKSLGAAKLIYGIVKRSGGDVVLTLKQVDTARGAIDGTTAENLAKKKLDPSALRALCRAVARAALGRQAGGGGGTPGTLIVRSNVSGATVCWTAPRSARCRARRCRSRTCRRASTRSPSRSPASASSTQVFTIGAGQALPLTLTLCAATPGAKARGRARRRRQPAVASGGRREAPGGDDALTDLGPHRVLGRAWGSARSRSAWPQVRPGRAQT